MNEGETLTLKASRLWFLQILLLGLLGAGFISLTIDPTTGTLVGLRFPDFSLPPAPRAVYVVKSTAYNSLASQTDSTPFITATGERTEPGIIALSRDLLGRVPYGSVVEIVGVWPQIDAPNGCGATMETVKNLKTLPGLMPGQFRVADTMHSRKKGQMDMWLENYEDAVNWGVCEVAFAPVENSLLAVGN